MKLDSPLLTPRLILRTLSAADANERYLGWMRDPEVTRYLESRLTDHDLGSLERFIESCNGAGDLLLLGICTADGRHIGNIKLGPVNAYHRRAALGLLIGERDCWGHGYATEAIARVSAYAFEVLRLEKLCAGCYGANVGSIRAFLKANWAEEGRSKGYWRTDNGREDDVRLGITSVDWSRARR